MRHCQHNVTPSSLELLEYDNSRVLTSWYQYTNCYTQSLFLLPPTHTVPLASRRGVIALNLSTAEWNYL